VIFGSALILLSNVTVIVVEDHDDSRTFMGLLLVRMGANVILAKDAVEGLEAVKNHGPDLVLTDIQMPGMDGFELLRRIRALGPDAGGNVPVVALTALETRIERTRMLNIGFQVCLQKPFIPEKLLETILSLLNN
jgi:CheY-like chemotaxis protein